MKGLVIGCGRTGSAVAKGLAEAGWDVTVVDENEDALARLAPAWQGEFVVGHGMDVTVLESARVREADAAVVSTDGDNTNIVIAQVLQQRYEIPAVVVRVLDPWRARFYAERGMNTICPTQTAIFALVDSVTSTAPRAAES